MVTISQRHESLDSSASALLILEVDIGDNGVLVFPMDFQIPSRDQKIKRNLSAGIAAIRRLDNLAY